MKYLVSTVETYRVETEVEAAALINEAKHSDTFTLAKYSSELKQKKSKGEVVEEWYRVTLAKEFNDEKDTEYNNPVKICYLTGEDAV